MASQITVTSERLTPRSISVVVDGIEKFCAVDGEDASVADLLNAIFTDSGQPERVVTPDIKTGNITLGDRVYILRDGAVAGRTNNGDAPVQAKDRVVLDRKHHNG